MQSQFWVRGKIISMPGAMVIISRPRLPTCHRDRRGVYLSAWLAARGVRVSDTSGVVVEEKTWLNVAISAVRADVSLAREERPHPNARRVTLKICIP